MNGYKVHGLIDPCTIHGDLISGNFCLHNKIPMEDMDAKLLETGITGSGSTITKKVTAELHIQENKIRRTCYVSNSGDRDAILVQTVFTPLNVIMYVRNIGVSIQQMGKPKQVRHILQTQLH